jgi:hypothetical protein
LVGAERLGCGLERHAAAVWRLEADGSTMRLWRDASPFNTFGRGVRRVAGGLEIVGFADRQVAVGQEPVSTASVSADYAIGRLRDEADAAGEMFALQLSNVVAEERRDFVAAGLPVVPLGLATSADHAVVFGSVGGRALWLER